MEAQEAVSYGETNPVRVRLVGQVEEYRWSSAAGHILEGSDPVLAGECDLEGEIQD